MPSTDPIPGLAADTLTGSAIREVAALTREAERVHRIEAEPGDLVVQVLTSGERIETLDLEDLARQPRAPRGSATLWDPADFISYVNRLASEHTTLWADPDAAHITAVYDDHLNSDEAGWRQHRATLVVRRDPEWQAWCALSGKLTSQEVFAEHLEDHYSSVIDPDAATMLEIATTFQASRSASFERGTRLQSGDVQLRFSEQTRAQAGASGHLEVPERFTIRVAPFWGVEAVDVQARLRYRIREGQLTIGYALHRPDIAEREAFDRIRATVIGGVEVDAHLGPAPQQVS